MFEHPIVLINTFELFVYYFEKPSKASPLHQQNIIAPNCTIWSSELNQNGFSCFPAYHTIPGETKGSPFHFFRHCETFFPEIFFPEGSPLQFFCCFATEWMLENPKGSPLSVFFGTVRFFSENKNFSPFQFFDVLRQNPFNCDKNVDNFGSVPLSTRQGLALAGPPARHSVHFLSM